MKKRHLFLALSAVLAQALVAPAGVAHATCPSLPNQQCQQSIPSIVIGSPSGLVGSYPVAIYTGFGASCTNRHLVNSGDLGGASPQIWLAKDDDFCDSGGIRLYTVDPSSNSLHCGNDEGCLVDWPYLEEVGNPVTFRPRFGGFGQISVQIELPCFAGCIQIGYDALQCVEARSTDFNADGDTDQDEKITLGQELTALPQNRHLQYDFNIDGVVDAADYRIVAAEMQTEIQQGYPALYACPSTNCLGCAPILVAGTFVPDASAPGATTLTLSGSGASVTLGWTSPGDDTQGGVQLGVAKEFELRGSASPITAANFASATLVAGAPAPGLPGTSHQLTVNACTLNMKYFAFKTKDYQGNLSAMSNVVVVPPSPVTDLGAMVHCTTIDLTWSAPGVGCAVGAASTYDLRKSRSVITPANFSGATPISTGAAGPPGTQELKNVPVGACSGRWYFALKALDAAGTLSALSNVASGGTPCIQHCDDEFASRPADPSDGPTAEMPLALAISNQNPARTSVQVRCSIPGARISEPFELAIFDASGRRVRTLEQGSARPGATTLTWDLKADGGGRVAAGVYFMRLRLGSDVRTQTLMVLQ
jgi:hypothetical protein